MDWATRIVELMWAAGLAVIPVAMIAAVCARWKGCRPATRHMLWFGVLATFLSPVAVGVWRPAWFSSERIIAAADSIVSPANRPIPAAHPKADVSQAAAPKVEVAGTEPAPSLNSMFTANAAPVLGSAPFMGPTLEQARIRKPEAATTRPARVVDQVKPRTAAMPPMSQWRPELTPPVVKDPLAESSYPAVPVEHPRQAAQSWGAQVRDWLFHVIAVRDALAAVPGIPPAVWLGGASVLAALWIVRLALVSRIIRKGEPAPAHLCAMVRRLAEVAGVKRVPKTIMVSDRVSPMIWCGLRPRLVIPRALWSELDSKCQCAVIVHELSHLKRRDHRLCWLDAIIGVLYWWHPVCWWARKRLRDEAESCCDAWVTTLLPGGRRAYAEALIATKSFLSMPGRSGAPGLGVVSARTRQLARRVTMVMTQRVAPRASVFGMAIAMAIAGAGVFVMPGLACPPEEAAAKAAEHKVKGQKVYVEKAVPGHAVIVAPREGEAFFGEAPALEAMRRQPGAAAAADARVQERMGVLLQKEASLRELEARLRAMEQRLQQLERSRQQGGRSGMTMPATPRPPMAASAPTAPVAPAPPAPPTGAFGGVRTMVLPSQPGVAAGAVRSRNPIALTVPGQRLSTAPSAIATTGETVARSYALPKGKLEALIELMSRQDVPILIEGGEDEIKVHASPAQHEVFGAFIKMINPEGHSAAPLDSAPLAGVLRAQAAERTAANAQREALRANSERMRQQAQEMARHQRDAARQSELYRKQVEKMKEKADQLRERGESTRDEVEGENGDAAEVVKALKEAEAAIAELDGLDCELDQLDCLSDQLDCQIEAINDAIEAMKEAAEEASVEESSAAPMVIEVPGVNLHSTAPVAVSPAPTVIAVPGVAVSAGTATTPAPTEAPAKTSAAPAAQSRP